MLRKLSLLLIALLATTVAGALLPASAGHETRHFTVNLRGDYAGPMRVGFDLLDVTPSRVSALPPGADGVVWVGQKCPTMADATFRATIDSLADNPRVFAYYLSDEPHIADCPGAAEALRSRANYIAQASDGKQHSFILLSRKADVTAFAPSKTNVTLIGLDPYPCSKANPTCDLSKIGDRVGWADAAGVPRSQIVPVYQTFGQENLSNGYYLLPTPGQLQAMLTEWAKYVPHPVMDYAYSWGNQSSSNPTLVDSPELQQVMTEWFHPATC